VAMIEYLKSEIEKQESYDKKFQRLRELLQIEILSMLDQFGAFNNIAFLGGTAPRILFDLKRFSEDLDFSLVNKQNYCFDSLLERFEKRFEKLSLTVEQRVRKKEAVNSVMFKFPKLLMLLGLSELESQSLKIKLEIDEKPPSGFTLQSSTMLGESLIIINHFDKASLFAGKLNTILERCFTLLKGENFCWKESNKQNLSLCIRI
jgi:hypothetical protein